MSTWYLMMWETAGWWWCQECFWYSCDKGSAFPMKQDVRLQEELPSNDFLKDLRGEKKNERDIKNTNKRSLWEKDVLFLLICWFIKWS